MGRRNKKPRKAGRMKKLTWFLTTAWRTVRTWKRSLFREQRELDAFRKCVRLERKSMDYPRAVPLLTELMKACRATGQEERRVEVMRRLRDIDPLPLPDFIWNERPSAKVVQHNVEAWCAKLERVFKDRRVDSLHPQQIEEILHINRFNAALVCDALEGRGLVGPYDMATGRHPVLVRSLVADRYFLF